LHQTSNPCLPQFRKLAQDADRDPALLSVDIFSALRDLEVLKRYRDAGINRVVLRLPSKTRDDVLSILDQSNRTKFSGHAVISLVADGLADTSTLGSTSPSILLARAQGRCAAMFLGARSSLLPLYAGGDGATATGRLLGLFTAKKSLWFI
jgi:hypothetical protein